jgi:hypothetical protein
MTPSPSRHRIIPGRRAHQRPHIVGRGRSRAGHGHRDCGAPSQCGGPSVPYSVGRQSPIRVPLEA